MGGDRKPSGRNARKSAGSMGITSNSGVPTTGHAGTWALIGSTEPLAEEGVAGEEGDPRHPARARPPKTIANVAGSLTITQHIGCQRP